MVLPDSSLSALMSFVPLKDYITNTGALMDGTQVLSVGDYVPRVDERTLTLVFYIKANTLTEFNERRDSLEAVFKQGQFTLWVEERPNDLYRLIYQSCSQFTQYNGRSAKFTLKVKEPNPNNRSL